MIKRVQGASQTKVIRTADLAPLGKNTPRKAAQLVKEGKLVRLRKGLFIRPVESRFGPVPPSEDELLRAFLKNTPYLVTGPERWNALGLGSTAVFAMPLVYNQKRSGTFDLGGKRFMLRRVPFPSNPAPEWFAIDLFENLDKAGLAREDATRNLTLALERRSLDRERLLEMATRFGTHRTQASIRQAIG